MDSMQANTIISIYACECTDIVIILTVRLQFLLIRMYQLLTLKERKNRRCDSLGAHT
jgi:hypothetical protein